MIFLLRSDTPTLAGTSRCHFSGGKRGVKRKEEIKIMLPLSVSCDFSVIDLESSSELMAAVDLALTLNMVPT